MPETYDSIRAILTHGYDTVIDVRSPAEYAVDHVPGAINLPALSNDERAEVGTTYKQVSPFDARKRGAALVARNVANHVAGPLALFDGGWKPLVYCWRGGQRSASFTMILQQIGWRAETVSGGYMQWRGLVKAALYDDPIPHKFVLLDGNTGTGKTAILGRLKSRGAQVIDLEGLAGHRGSILGGMAAGQPAQKAFDTALATAIDGCDPARPIVLEAESAKIGRINIPPQVWTKMITAPRIMIEAPITARAAFLEKTYLDMIQDPTELATRLAPLRKIRGRAVLDSWLELLAARNYNGLATALMEQHYDAAYAKSRKSQTHPTIKTVKASTLDGAGQDAVAAEIMQALSVL